MSARAVRAPNALNYLERGAKRPGLVIADAVRFAPAWLPPSFRTG